MSSGRRGSREQSHPPGCTCDQCDWLHLRPLVLDADRRARRIVLARALKPTLRRALGVEHAEAHRVAATVAAVVAWALRR